MDHIDKDKIKRKEHSKELILTRVLKKTLKECLISDQFQPTRKVS